MNSFRYFLDFKGRAIRETFWLNLIVVGACGIAANIAMAHVLGIPFLSYGHYVGGAGLQSVEGRRVLAFELPVTIASIFLTLAVTVRRLHDRNRSGWWVVPFIYAPWIVNFCLAAAFGSTVKPTAPVLLVHLVVSVLGFWGLVEFGFLRGTAGPNRYGPDPQAEG